MNKIKKILVANRGEIALRIMRTAKIMGIETIAVYSEADIDSPHVKFADQAVNIGEAASAKSYLSIEKIINAAKKTNADAIHPGYGFLSERAAFAQAVNDSGLIFIGPSSEAIDLMGDKITAKKTAEKAGLPLLPGTKSATKDEKELVSAAKKTGFPLLIKASAGGGGKGMRVVMQENELEEAIERAISEAEKAFGDGRVFIEKYVTRPKHIEIQVMADSFGNAVHLFERECSIQRRHQKVIEEAPSPVVSEELRSEMGKKAADLAKSCGYRGAGTVEFIMDEQKNYYFLEMNTRLQVEHPVTEEITGKDLVKEQIRIAQGEKLSFSQSDLRISGHAIELRVYAEDPFNNFLPDTGKLINYKRPSAPHIRLDDAYEEGMEIPIHYDPMIAKLTVWGETRNDAILKMIKASKAYKIAGIETTLGFGEFALSHEDFVEGTYSTKFIEEHFSTEKLKNFLHSSSLEKEAATALASYINEVEQAKPEDYQSPSRNDWSLRRL